MKNKDIALNKETISVAASTALGKFRMYRIFLLFLAIAGLYGYILWRVNIYSAIEPDATEASSQSVRQPHINKNLAEKMQKLEANNVNVKALFDEARNNPFAE